MIQTFPDPTRFLSIRLLICILSNALDDRQGKCCPEFLCAEINQAHRVLYGNPGSSREGSEAWTWGYNGDGWEPGSQAVACGTYCYIQEPGNQCQCWMEFGIGEKCLKVWRSRKRSVFVCVVLGMFPSVFSDLPTQQRNVKETLSCLESPP